MSKIKLTKVELAALDAMIASMESDSSVYGNSVDSAAFITAIARTAIAVTRVATKATPVVTQVTPEVVGAAANVSENLSRIADKGGNLNLDSLIELRRQATGK